MDLQWEMKTTDHCSTAPLLSKTSQLTMTMTVRTDEDFFQEEAIYLKRYCNNINLETDLLCSAKMKEKVKACFYKSAVRHTVQSNLYQINYIRGVNKRVTVKAFRELKEIKHN